MYGGLCSCTCTPVSAGVFGLGLSQGFHAVVLLKVEDGSAKCLVTDNGSTNGTFVIDAGTGARTRLKEGSATEMSSGARVAFGKVKFSLLVMSRAGACLLCTLVFCTRSPGISTCTFSLRLVAVFVLLFY